MRRPGLVGADPAFRALVKLARKVAPARSPVVLVGPTGSGKSHLARFLHAAGAHPSAPYVEWHPGGVPESLLEADLLGVGRGAATGVAARSGALEAAGRGTLCLVGIEHMDHRRQAVLLRALEERSVERVGGGRGRFEARIVASFLEPPEGLVGRGLLREDLLYRLDVVRLELPSLAERREDVPALAAHFLRAACRGRRPVPALAPDLVEALRNHPWPGNLRELAQRMEGLALLDRDPLSAEDLPPSFWLVSPVEDALRSRLTLAELRDAYIRAVLARLGGNRSRAARWLGISRKALWTHLRRRAE